ITALIGAALGLPLGVALAALATRALADKGLSFTVPAVPLVAFVIVALVAGVVAAVLPARRAARLNVLRALQYEWRAGCPGAGGSRRPGGAPGSEPGARDPLGQEGLRDPVARRVPGDQLSA